MKRLSLLLVVASIFPLGCSQDQSGQERTPRAVSYLTIELTEPGPSNRLTGTVESWKREDLGFDVAGRVLRVAEPGIDIEGRTFDENGKLLLEGTVLAELDRDSFCVRLLVDAASLYRNHPSVRIPHFIGRQDSSGGTAGIQGIHAARTLPALPRDLVEKQSKIR